MSTSRYFESIKENVVKCLQRYYSMPSGCSQNAGSIVILHGLKIAGSGQVGISFNTSKKYFPSNGALKSPAADCVILCRSL